MTLVTTHRWVCDVCGKDADADTSTPEGWQSIHGERTRHACSRACAAVLLLADVDQTLDYWFPQVEAAQK